MTNITPLEQGQQPDGQPGEYQEWINGLFCATPWRETHVQAPYYLDDATQMISVLQHFQTLYSNPAGVSLADILSLIQRLQQLHGEQTTLEAIIQHAVGEQLCLQLRQRQAHRLQEARAAA